MSEGGDAIATLEDKEAFLKAFKDEVRKDASSCKGKAKEFAAELNKDGREKLRAMFRAAVKPDAQDEASAGLANLFDMNA